MPELPEVETVVRGLREKLLGLEFSRGRVRLRKLIQGSPDRFLRTLRGKRILSIGRRGKYILFHLTEDWILVGHLRMTGKFQFVPRSTPQEKHTHLIWGFKDHSFDLRFVDPRQFGRIILLKAGKDRPLESFLDLGPEPLKISVEDFIRLTRQKKRGIKALLLDQRVLAGLGNIYADETLHSAGIHPRGKAHSLSPATLSCLHQEIRRILLTAIRSRGASVRTYVDANGSTGGFQKKLQVYGQEGEPCRACRTLILREKIAGRSTFFCPRCQPGGDEEKTKGLA